MCVSLHINQQIMQIYNWFVHLQELNVLQINTEAQLKVLEADLKSAKSAVTALKDRNKDLGKI